MKIMKNQIELLIEEINNLIVKKYLTLQPEYNKKKKYYFNITVAKNYIIFATNNLYTNPSFEVYENNTFTPYNNKHSFKEYLLTLQDNKLKNIIHILKNNHLQDKKTFILNNIISYLEKYTYLLRINKFYINNVFTISYSFQPYNIKKKYLFNLQTFDKITNLIANQTHSKYSLIKKFKTFDILTLYIIYITFKNYELTQKKRKSY
jgi:hypothetical protein